MWDGQIVGFVFEVQNHIVKFKIRSTNKKKIKTQ